MLSPREKFSHSLIIVVTGNEDIGIEKSALTHGADIFFRKPLGLAAFAGNDQEV